MRDSTGTTDGGTSKRLSERVVEAVADAEGVDPTELEPLFTVVDPDALDALFRPQWNAGAVPDATAEIEFNYRGYEVRAAATGRVLLTEHD